jgi:hypothetical protein
MYKTIRYKEPTEFLKYISTRNPDATNITVVEDYNGSYLFIQNDKDPDYWTSFDDQYVVFDSFNLDYESTVMASKSRCLAYTNPPMERANSSIPNLPDEAFPALIEESKSVAFLVLKEMANQKAEQKSARQQRWLSRKAWKAHGGIEYPDYGRKR